MSYNPFQGRQVPRVGQFPGPFAGPSGAPCDASQAAAQAAAAAAGQGQGRIRRAILGLEAGKDSAGVAPVPAGAVFTSVTQPQKAFRGLRIVIGSDLAAKVVLTNVQIGIMPQFVSTDTEIPGLMFSEQAVDAAFDDFDWCPTSDKIRVTGKNIDGNANDVRIALLGLVLEC